jgi:NAD(P)-dependent dehydrogenase (short-subunit alcohol dehydrogenase family)
MTQSTFLITGASRGLGLAAAMALSKRAEHRLILAIRDPSSIEKVLPALKAQGAVVEVRPLDLTSLESVRSFIASWAEPLAGVVLNAGVQIISGTRMTVDGYEETFAVNHLSQLVLAMGLRRYLEAGRLVFLGSGTHNPSDAVAKLFGFRGGVLESAEALAKGEGVAGSLRQMGLSRYATSKLFNISAAHALADQWKEVRVMALDPGLMAGTGLARDNNAVLRLAWKAIGGLVPLLPGASTTERSGATLAWLLSAPSAEIPAHVYFDFARRPIEPWAEAVTPLQKRRAVEDTLGLV